MMMMMGWMKNGDICDDAKVACSMLMIQCFFFTVAKGVIILNNLTKYSAV